MTAFLRRAGLTLVACVLLTAAPSSALAVPPAVPTITASVPASPGNDLRPEIAGTADPGSTVTIYTNNTCTGTIAAQGPAETFTTTGLTVTVAAGSTTFFYASAFVGVESSGCSAPFHYVEDPAPPPAPTVAPETVPASPSSDNTPQIRGTAADGTEVRLYTNAACTGEAAGIGTAAQFASSGIGAQVGDNTVTFFYASAFDGTFSSACSTTFALYTHQLPKPPAPVFSDTDPDSPANEHVPYVKGSAAANGLVRIYTTPTCTPPRASEALSAQFASPGIQTTVFNDSVTTFYATVQVGAAVSDCSASLLTYVEDSTPPETTIASGPPATVARGSNVRFEFAASEAGSRFVCHLHEPGFQPCVSPATFPAAPTGAPGGGKTLQVRAIDRAGNEDGSSATRSYTVAAAPVPPPPPSPPAGCTLRVAAIVGTAGANTINGTARADIVYGRAGNDLLRGLAGGDCLYGETGNDRLRGGSGADRLLGGPGADRLEGESGNDRMTGASGNDRLTDRAGRDSFSGGAGNDRIDARDTSAFGRRVRDTVACGTGTRDVVLADRRDLVLRDCERISRR